MGTESQMDTFWDKAPETNVMNGNLDQLLPRSCQHNDMFTPEIMDVHLTPIGFAGVFAANFPKHHFSRERVERCLGLEGHDGCNPEKVHMTRRIWSTNFSTI